MRNGQRSTRRTAGLTDLSHGHRQSDRLPRGWRLWGWNWCCPVSDLASYLESSHVKVIAFYTFLYILIFDTWVNSKFFFSVSLTQSVLVSLPLSPLTDTHSSWFSTSVNRGSVTKWGRSGVWLLQRAWLQFLTNVSAHVWLQLQGNPMPLASAGNCTYMGYTHLHACTHAHEYTYTLKNKINLKSVVKIIFIPLSESTKKNR